MQLYDMNDYDYKEYVRGLCLAGLPIPFYSKQLNHIKVKDVFMMGESNYNMLINPFRINSDVLFEKPKNGEKRYLLDILLSNDYQMHIQLQFVLEFLKLVFATDKIELTHMTNENGDGFHKEILVDNDLWIDREKFEQLSEIILEMNRLKKITKSDINIEKKERRLTYEQIMNIKDRRERDYQLAIYKKNQKEEAKQRKASGFYSIYNYVCHSSNMVDYEKPLNLNLFQFHNTYIILNKTEKYRYDMRLISSGMITDFKKIDTRWFNERIVEE